jgi:hypothetical protein
MIVMCPDNHVFVTQPRIGAIEHGDDVATGPVRGVRIDRARERHVLEITAVGSASAETELAKAGRDEIAGTALTGRSGESALERIVRQITDGRKWLGSLTCERARIRARE